MCVLCTAVFHREHPRRLGAYLLRLVISGGWVRSKDRPIITLLWGGMRRLLMLGEEEEMCSLLEDEVCFFWWITDNHPHWKVLFKVIRNLNVWSMVNLKVEDWCSADCRIFWGGGNDLFEATRRRVVVMVVCIWLKSTKCWCQRVQSNLQMKFYPLG